MHPRLTIGIPTLGRRPDLLTKAIATALGQSVPAKVLVADQADDGAVERIVAPFLGHPLFRRVPSPARCLWENWCIAAECCDTEFFAWLQDDDVLAPHFALRVVTAMDRHPRSNLWIARLGISLTDGAANWWQATGPMVPMDLLCGGTTEVYGSLLAAGAYFTSFALSPAVAFRWSVQACEAARRCPMDADLYVERSILAELARGGCCICDPAIVGYWTMHAGNESRRQIEADGVPTQYAAMARQIDRILTETPGWQAALEGWLMILGREQVARMLKETEGFAGVAPTLDEARSILSRVAPLTHAVATASGVPEASRTKPVETTVHRRASRAERAVRR